MGKKICFVSSRSGYLNNNSIITDWANGRLISELLKNQHFEWSVAIFDDPQKAKSYDYTINCRRIYGLPFPFSYKAGLINSFKAYRIFKKLEAQNDILIVQLPIISFIPLLFLRKPILYHLCANVLTASDNPLKYKGVKAYTAKYFALLIHHINQRLFSKNRIRLITNGTELASLYKKHNPIKVISSSISKEDIVKTIPSRKPSPWHILFIGRPSLEKGFDVLISCLLQLQFDFRLTVIGFTKEDFKAILPFYHDKSFSIMDKIAFKGFMSWGDELKAIIRQHHVLIVPSRSEGTPRVILEAMSQGVAIIASNIGGIPDLIEDRLNGLLFDFKSDSDLLEKIVSLQSSEEFQNRLALSALKKANENTINDFSKNFIQTLMTI